MSIAVVDISSVVRDHIWREPSIMQQIHTALTTVEFVFITGHGISRAGEGLQFNY